MADAFKQRAAIFVQTLSGAKVPDAYYSKLAANETAAEKDAVLAAQLDPKWLTLSRAAAGIAGEPVDPNPSNKLTAAINECSAQGLG